MQPSSLSHVPAPPSLSVGPFPGPDQNSVEATPYEVDNHVGNGLEGVGGCPEVDQTNHVGDQNVHDREGSVRMCHHVVGHRGPACEQGESGQNVGLALGHGTVAQP